MTRQGKLLVTLAIVGALYLLARTDKGSTFVTDILSSGSRGIRNNNPGNIRKSGTVWAGQVPNELQKDSAFVIFSAPEYGIRAMAKILRSYIGRGVNTVEKIIATWAPPSENNTSAYVAAVAKESGLAPGAILSTFDVVKLIPAMIRHENGSQPYARSLIDKGVALA